MTWTCQKGRLCHCEGCQIIDEAGIVHTGAGGGLSVFCQSRCRKVSRTECPIKPPWDVAESCLKPGPTSKTLARASNKVGFAPVWYFVARAVGGRIDRPASPPGPAGDLVRPHPPLVMLCKVTPTPGKNVTHVGPPPFSRNFFVKHSFASSRLNDWIYTFITFENVCTLGDTRFFGLLMYRPTIDQTYLKKKNCFRKHFKYWTWSYKWICLRIYIYIIYWSPWSNSIHLCFAAIYVSLYIYITQKIKHW